MRPLLLSGIAKKQKENPLQRCFVVEPKSFSSILFDHETYMYSPAPFSQDYDYNRISMELARCRSRIKGSCKLAFLL